MRALWKIVTWFDNVGPHSSQMLISEDVSRYDDDIHTSLSSFTALQTSFSQPEPMGSTMGTKENAMALNSANYLFLELQYFRSWTDVSCALISFPIE